MSHQKLLQQGTVIPAHPLALDASRKLDEARQRALTRYYLTSGAGGLAVGVHTTQFEIHQPQVGLYEPVLQLAREVIVDHERHAPEAQPIIRVAGIVGDTSQAVAEAKLAASLGYHYGLVSLAGLKNKSVAQLVDHYRAIGEVLDVFAFYLQPSVGGIELPMAFWRTACELSCVKAIKIAAFDRYKTLTVVRAVAESDRRDIALYTGNDDNIVADLLTPFRFAAGGTIETCHIVGGLLGQWAVGTPAAVRLFDECRRVARGETLLTADLLAKGVQLTDFNAAMFDAANDFRGCLPGIHEVLRRQGLLSEISCLDPDEQMSPGQVEEIARVVAAYPELLEP